jgi:hypothetical protein
MKRARMVSVCVGATLAISPVAAGAVASGSASAPRVAGASDLSGQTAPVAVKAPAHKRAVRDGRNKRCRMREHWTVFKAAHTKGFNARRIARRERFDSKKLARRERFRSTLEQERVSFVEGHNTVAEREQFREGVKAQRHAFWATQAALWKKFRERQSGRRKAFEEWLRKLRRSFEQLLAQACGTVGDSGFDDALRHEGQQQEKAEIAMDAQEETTEADEERQAEVKEQEQGL